MAKNKTVLANRERHFTLHQCAENVALYNYLLANYSPSQYMYKTPLYVVFFCGWDVITADDVLCALLLGAINWPQQEEQEVTFNNLMA